MVNGKTPLFLTVIAAIVIGAVVLFVQPYSADFPGTAYARPARAFLRAAIRRDSSGLDHMSASPRAVDWALRAARTHPDTLAAWGGRTLTYVTSHRADTAEILVYPAHEPCSEVPIVMRVVGSGRHARVVQASSSCLALAGGDRE